MPLAQENPEIPGQSEQLNETGQTVKKELKDITQKVEESVEESRPQEMAKILEFKTPEARQDAERQTENQSEEKSLKELEGELNILLTSIDPKEWEGKLVKEKIEEIAKELTEKEENPNNILAKILEIARNLSGDDDGTYAWVLSELEEKVNNKLKNKRYN